MLKALLIIDMQRFVTDRMQQGVAYHPVNAVENMKCILKQFRQAGQPVIHVRHRTSEQGSLLHENSPSFLPVESFEEQQGEPVFTKTTSSAFSSTDLLSYIQRFPISEIVVTGAVAGFCVNSTVRAGADSGLQITVIEDAVISFELHEQHISAKSILDVTLALLKTDFAKVIATAEFQVV